MENVKLTREMNSANMKILKENSRNCCACKKN